MSFESFVSYVSSQSLKNRLPAITSPEIFESLQKIMIPWSKPYHEHLLCSLLLNVIEFTSKSIIREEISAITSSD